MPGPQPGGIVPLVPFVPLEPLIRGTPIDLAKASPPATPLPLALPTPDLLTLVVLTPVVLTPVVLTPVVLALDHSPALRLRGQWSVQSPGNNVQQSRSRWSCLRRTRLRWTCLHRTCLRWTTVQRSGCVASGPCRALAAMFSIHACAGHVCAGRACAGPQSSAPAARTVVRAKP